MLESLLLKNCQRFKRLFIQFGPGATVLTGNSDAGKSTVWRALRIVCLNPHLASCPKEISPKGPRFARHGSSWFEITLKVDGHTIIRKKGHGINIYILDGQIYKNPDKTGIPKSIQQILKVSGLNFQSQHSMPLWFHDSPSQVGRELNRIINLEAIDQVLANSAALSRKAKSSFTETKSRLKEAKQELEELSHVPRFVSQVQSLRMLSEKIEEGQERLETGVQLLHRIEKTETNIASLPTTRKINVIKLDRLANTINGKSQQLDRLSELLEAIRGSRRKIQCLTEQRNAIVTESKRIMTKVKSCPLCQRPIQS